MAERVGDVDVVPLGIRAPDSHSGSSVVVRYVYEREIVGYGRSVGGIRAAIRGVALDCETGFESWYVDLFCVGARSDKDCLGCG